MRMSSRMQRNLALLELVYKSSPSVRRVIVNNAGSDFINALCEIALNVLRGNIPLSDKQYNQLKKKKKSIKLITVKGVKLAKKKKTINQTGGFLLPLLGAAIPFIFSLINKN